MKNLFFTLGIMFSLTTTFAFSDNSTNFEEEIDDCTTVSLSCGIDSMFCDFNDTELMVDEAMKLDNEICG